MKKYLTYRSLIRYGLGTIFITHGLVALIAPTEFIELLENSFVSALLPIDPATFVKTVVMFNDTIVGLLLFSGFRLRLVASWATLWLVGVMIVIGNDLMEILEHIGLLFVSVALIIEDTLHT